MTTLEIILLVILAAMLVLSVFQEFIDGTYPPRVNLLTPIYPILLIWFFIWTVIKAVYNKIKLLVFGRYAHTLTTKDGDVYRVTFAKRLYPSRTIWEDYGRIKDVAECLDVDYTIEKIK